MSKDTLEGLDIAAVSQEVYGKGVAEPVKGWF